MFLYLGQQWIQEKSTADLKEQLGCAIEVLDESHKFLLNISRLLARSKTLLSNEIFYPKENIKYIDGSKNNIAERGNRIQNLKKILKINQLILEEF